MNKEDFPMLEGDLVFFDNGATTLKPTQVIEDMDKYYSEFTSNIHRGDYDAAIETNTLFDETRNTVKEFVNARSEDKCIYTSGTTMSINMVVFSFMKSHLKKGDVVLLTKSEHASNILPWFKLKEEIGIDIQYIPLNKNYELTINNLKKVVNNKVKVVSIAHVTNVIGDIRDVEKIGEFCRENNIYFCVDGAQSVPHLPVDFSKSNMDFLSFSGHKMLGPTGIGCLVVRGELFNEMDPLFLGGGMNLDFYSDGKYELHTDETKFEAGTPPIGEVIGLRSAILYLEKIGMENIHEHEKKLKEYLVSKLEKMKNIRLYNTTSASGIVSFNVDGIFAQDISIYLNKYKIAIRAGNHCAKLLHEEIGEHNTVRVSMYLYNDLLDVDRLIDALNNKDILKEVI